MASNDRHLLCLLFPTIIIWKLLKCMKNRYTVGVMTSMELILECTPGSLMLISNS